MYGAQLIGAEHPYAHIIKLVQRALVWVAVFVALPNGYHRVVRVRGCQESV